MSNKEEQAKALWKDYQTTERRLNTEYNRQAHIVMGSDLPEDLKELAVRALAKKLKLDLKRECNNVAREVGYLFQHVNW